LAPSVDFFYKDGSMGHKRLTTKIELAITDTTFYAIPMRYSSPVLLVLRGSTDVLKVGFYVADVIFTTQADYHWLK
jgi:hypothetical protein